MPVCDAVCHGACDVQCSRHYGCMSYDPFMGEKAAIKGDSHNNYGRAHSVCPVYLIVPDPEQR